MTPIMKTVRRTWRERLFSRPFFVATKQVRDYDAELMRRLARDRPMIMPSEMRGGSPMRTVRSAGISSSRVQYDPRVSHTETSGTEMAFAAYMLGAAQGPSHAQAPAQPFASGGGGDFGGAGASGSWGSSDSCQSSDSSSSSSSSDSGSSSSSDGGSCSSSD